ncbi:hypothetical protein ACXXHD_11570 [Staphylococcus epidermidis]|uniref:hypothetical protein n=1 Tax=Staphylococcus epidermidis TaxID=1282 RepID=UPI0011A36265|nr:hypothetical protein [Staphylococcus epidermidis]
MEDLFFKDEDVIKVINEVEIYITKGLNNSQDIQKFKENHLFLAIYDIAHTFYLNYIDINNCVTISSARTLSSEIELSSFTNYIVSRFIELCCDFTNKKELWSGYKQQFEEYYNNKWNHKQITND